MWDRFGEWLWQANDFQFFGSAALAGVLFVAVVLGIAMLIVKALL